MNKKTRDFLVTTPNNDDGVLYSYTEEGIFTGVQIKGKDVSVMLAQSIIISAKPLLDEFLNWCKTFKKIEVVELQKKITFEMFWLKYNDRSRSSKKKSEKLWNKLDEANQVKAYYHYETYNRNRGNAEKKYCETYLSVELWNN